MSIEPTFVTYIFNTISPPLALVLFQTLKEKGYPLNIFIYNAIIKKQPFEEGIKLLKTISGDNITPDIQTIQPLLRKWDSLDQFVATIRMSKLYSIEPDQKAIDTITYRVKDLSITEEFLEFFYARSRNDENNWDRAISKVCNLELVI